MDWLLGSPEPAKPPAASDWLLRARLCSWSYSSTDEIRCELRLEPTAGVSAPLWVDWLAAQCCGFVVHRGADPPSPTPPPPSGALPDEARAAAGDAGRRCFAASAPHVVAAGTRLDGGGGFVVRARLPAALPPSYDGTTVAIEYVLVLSVRRMRAPAAGGGAEWGRGPICRLRLPIRVLARAGGDVAAAPPPPLDGDGPPLGIEVSSEAHDDGDGGESDGGGVDSEADESDDGGDDDGDNAPRRFDVQVDGRQLAVVALETVGCPAGGALRGIIALAGGEPACELLALRLLLEEVLPERAAAAGEGAPPWAAAAASAAREVALQTWRDHRLRQAEFELGVPDELPPQLATSALLLRWVLAFRFELSGGGSVEWRLPVRVRAARRPPPPPPFARALELETVVHDGGGEEASGSWLSLIG